MYILVFDTETSGLPKYRKQLINDTENWPFILQFAWILFDIEKNLIIEKYNKLISVSDNVNIDENSIKIHNITREICNKNGENIKDILNLFKKSLEKSDLIIGHNIKFDKDVIMVECIRNNISINFNKREYCTMLNSKNICKLPFKNNNNYNNNYKYPKLEELVEYLFQEKNKGFHDAFVDILFTLRCYVKLINNIDIFIINNEIKNYFKN